MLQLNIGEMLTFLEIIPQLSKGKFPLMPRLPMNGNHRGAKAKDLLRFSNKIACLIDINHFLKTNSIMALE